MATKGMIQPTQMIVATGMIQPAQVIVAIDFGTTYSGFSFAHMHSAEEDVENFLDNVQGYEQWPSQAKAGAKAYCKTQTSLLYLQKMSTTSVPAADYELKGWGWSAYCEYLNLLQKGQIKSEGHDKRFHFITKFKLGLAGSNKYGESYTLPKGLTVERVVSDYLYQLSILIEKELQNKYGEHISKTNIQWCLTVPAIWDNISKQQMKKCAEIAGLVTGPANLHGEASAHPIIMVLEPEAASVYCLHYLRKTHKSDLPAKSKILIVDAGGGTVDLVLHEKVTSGANCNQVKEICNGSSGALCGATVVDDAFYKLLSRKINCYEAFLAKNPSAVFKIRSIWEDIKFCFDGSEGPYEFWLPAKLGNFWETYNVENGLDGPECSYDDIKITLEEMKTVFDSAVDTILNLIEGQLAHVESKDVDALMVVGGFSGSPYLMDKIRTAFGGRVKRVINPSHAGKAVVTGAVTYGCLGKEIVISRISRKTYGILSSRKYRSDIDPLSYKYVDKDGQSMCDNVFNVFVRQGDPVPVNACVKRSFRNKSAVADHIPIRVYSSMLKDPKYVTESGTVMECSYNFPIPCKKDMEKNAWIEVSMYFGRTSVEFTAVAKNFSSQKAILPSITFDGTDSTR